MKQGIYTGISFEDYLAIPAVNKSNLEWMRFSPLHYFTYCEDPKRDTKRTQTEPMKLGTAIHTAILEPKTFRSRYVLIPEDAPKRPTSAQINAKNPSPESVASIAWWAKFNAETEGKEVLSSEEWGKCRSIRDGVLKNPAAQALLEDGQAEVTLVWNDRLEIDPLTGEGMLCKARIDWLGPALLDFKSVDSARAHEFAKKVVNYNWHVQAAFYSDGFEAITGERKPFVFGALEKDPPFASQFFSVNDPSLEIGRALYRQDLSRVANCRRTQEWPGYPFLINELALPSWAGKELSYGGPTEY